MCINETFWHKLVHHVLQLTAVHTRHVRCKSLSIHTQARSQACLSGVVNFHWKNHLVQNMRTYFIFYVITIKCMNCMQKKTEFSCKLQIPTLISTNILGDLSLATKIKQQNSNKNCKKILRGGKKMESCCPGVAVATQCHPIARGLSILVYQCQIPIARSKKFYGGGQTV